MMPEARVNSRSMCAFKAQQRDNAMSGVSVSRLQEGEQTIVRLEADWLTLHQIWKASHFRA
jgi:hypothetical protein